MTEQHVRVCRDHGKALEDRSGRLWCSGKGGVAAPHWCERWVVIDRRRGRALYDATAAAYEVEPMEGRVVMKDKAEKKGESKVSTLERWKGQDQAGRVLWLRIMLTKRRGEAYLLRWEIEAGRKKQQGVWVTAPDEQKARAEFTAAVARQKTAGWKELEITQGGRGNLQLKPIPAPERKAKAA